MSAMVHIQVPGQGRGQGWGLCDHADCGDLYWRLFTAPRQSKWKRAHGRDTISEPVPAGHRVVPCGDTRQIYRRSLVEAFCLVVKLCLTTFSFYLFKYLFIICNIIILQ